MTAIGLQPAIAAAQPGLERLNVAQLHRMIELGILREGAPIELVDGLLIRKNNSDRGGDPMTHGPKHAYCLQRLKELDTHVKPHGCHLRQQLPITLADYEEPEPDIAIVRGAVEEYRGRHPGPSECVAVIEVADSSLHYDRMVKAPTYAAAGIPQYWIVNIPERQIEVYRSPKVSGRQYAERKDYREGEAAILTISTELSIDVQISAILP